MIDRPTRSVPTSADGDVSVARLTIRYVTPCHLELVGELDLVTAPQLTAAIETTANNGTTTVTVDVAGVTFIDSSGLTALLSADRQLGPRRRLTLLWPTRAIRRLLDISGLTEHLLDHDQRIADGP